MGKTYWVYLLANEGRTPYCGFTGDLNGRAGRHKFEAGSKFTSKYGVTKLVWFESYSSPQPAIEREKEIKGWRREKKIALIEAMNPEWDDLYASLN